MVDDTGLPAYNDIHPQVNKIQPIFSFAAYMLFDTNFTVKKDVWGRSFK